MTADFGTNHEYRATIDIDVPLSSTAAVFPTEVDNAQTNDPEDSTLTVLNGDQRVDGVELGARYADSAQTATIPGFTSAAENHVFPGPGRTARLTIRAAF